MEGGDDERNEPLARRLHIAELAAVLLGADEQHAFVVDAGGELLEQPRPVALGQG